MSEMVPVADPGRENSHLAAAVDGAVSDVVHSGTYVQGPHHDAFEVELASYVGSTHGIGTANATDALEIVLRGLDCGAGAEVITVANAGGFGSAAARLVGASPVHVDVTSDTLLADVDGISAAIGPRTGAVILTHLFGQMHPATAALVALCERHSVPLIEDCAQATGARLDGRHAGSFGVAGIFSFYPTKNLGAIGDAGMITTDDPVLADRSRALRQYGRAPLISTELDGGRNSRLDEIQAAVLRVKLPHLDEFVGRRRAIVQAYRDADPDRWWAGGDDPSYAAHLAVTRVPDRDRFRAAAAAAGIATSVHFPRLDRRCHRDGRAPSPLPVSQAAIDEIVTLPCHPLMTPAEIDRVVELVADGPT